MIGNPLASNALAPFIGPLAIPENYADICFYDLLGISKTSSEREVKQALNILIAKIHPDALLNFDLANERLKRYAVFFEHIMMIKAVLLNVKNKKLYDKYGIISGHKKVNFKQEASKQLGSLILELATKIENPEYIDILRLAEEHIATNLKQVKRSIEKTKKELKDLNKIIKRFGVKNRKNKARLAILTLPMEEHAKQKVLQQLQLSNQILMFKEIIKALSKFTYEVSTRPQPEFEDSLAKSVFTTFTINEEKD